jgi:hypothetical protein
MSESVEAVAAAYRRRVTRDFAVVASAVLGACLLVAAVAPLAAAAATALAATAALYAPAFRSADRAVLTTDRPPAAVREDLVGEATPFLAIERTWADGVDREDGAWTLSYTTAAVLRRDVRYEATTEEGVVRVSVSVNDAAGATYEATVEAAGDGGPGERIDGGGEDGIDGEERDEGDGQDRKEGDGEGGREGDGDGEDGTDGAPGSRVTVTRRRPGRVGLRTLLFDRARRGYDRRAYRALGYGVGPADDG